MADEDTPEAEQSRRDRAAARAKAISEKALDRATDLRDRHSSISFSTEVWERFKAVEGNEAVLILTLLYCVAVLPAAIIAFAVSAWITGSNSSFGQSMAQVWHLAPGPAEELTNAFTTNKASLASAASVGVLTFVMVGVGYSATLEKVYRIAWKVPELKPSISGYFTRLAVFLALFSEIGFVHVISAAVRRVHQPFRAALLLVVAAPIVAVTWILISRVFLRGSWPGTRAVLPGILAGMAGLVALDLVGGILLGNWITTYTDFFGAGGIMLALLFWYWIIAYVWVLMPVISAVLYERRGVVGIANLLVEAFEHHSSDETDEGPGHEA